MLTKVVAFFLTGWTHIFCGPSPRWVFDIVPIKRPRKKPELPKDTQEILYFHKTVVLTQ